MTTNSEIELTPVRSYDNIKLKYIGNGETGSLYNDHDKYPIGFYFENQALFNDFNDDNRYSIDKRTLVSINIDKKHKYTAYEYNVDGGNCIIFILNPDPDMHFTKSKTKKSNSKTKKSNSKTKKSNSKTKKSNSKTKKSNSKTKKSNSKTKKSKTKKSTKKKIKNKK
jgi:hypothetical protein